MKRLLLLHTGILCYTFLSAQTPEDALRSAWFTPNGTARYISIGGVMGSLGGDITAANVNPAGLGFFKTNEFVITPGFQLNNNKLSFRGSDTTNRKNAFAYGTTGYVFGIPSSDKSSSAAISISINQLASYNNHVKYRGANNLSSFSEQYLEELARDRADTNSALGNYIFGSSLAFRTYLIDTARVNGQFAYKTMVPVSDAVFLPGVMQEYDSRTRGGLHEIALAIAAHSEDKFYGGLSLNFPISVYTRTLNYKESDLSGDDNNDFNYFTFREKTTSVGVGMGAKLGVIYKPKEYWRLGLALHTPQYIKFRDEIRAWMTTDTEGYAGVVSESSDRLNNNQPGEREYYLLTPWRAIASASYVFREVQDTRKQRAFISADIEYVNYRGARFSRYDEEDYAAKDYYKSLNRAVKDYYQGNVNFRLGGELKLNTWMFRLGGAYYGSPYAEKELKANRILATGGLGYRNYGFFVDLAYSHQFVKDVNFPYMLNDKPNTFAAHKGSKGNVVMTVGFKF